ncbi:hypothetical protein AALO_G00282210 [Alosa alosa]|uniref:Uncharacterized protein n=1 Tax=Alosa alosa TaxID=278164 RepID=A0AAV6FMQ1_9TELE|nr:hypothetical protein AALO_G00282210 [Alosa alosa]
MSLGGLPYEAPGPQGQPDGQYGAPEGHYSPETISLGGNAKSGKYGNPALPYETLPMGPITDGKSVEPLAPYEALPPVPQIDGVKSIDQFGEGELPPQPQPDGQVVLGEGAENPTTGKGDYVTGAFQPEVVSFSPAASAGPAPVDSDAAPSLAPAPAVSAPLPDDSSLPPLSLVVPLVSAAPPAGDSGEVPGADGAPPSQPPPQASDHEAELPPVLLQPGAHSHQIHIQQHLKFHFHPKSWKGGKETKYELNGFFGNGYQG